MKLIQATRPMLPYCSQYDVETYSRYNALGYGYGLRFSNFDLQPPTSSRFNISTIDQVGVKKPLAAIHDASCCCYMLPRTNVRG